jgi:hypothetical protein
MLRRMGIATWIVLILAAAPLAAQQPPEQWHLNGSAGVNLLRDSNTPIISQAPESEFTSVNSTAAGALRLALDGYAKDPRLLPFSLDFSGERGANAVDVGSYRNTLLNWGFNTVFLPERPWPLRFYIRHSQYDANGGVFNETSDNSAMGLDWTLNLPKLPKITVGYTRLANKIRLPTSLTSSSYDQRLAHLEAQDTWKAWEWTAGVDSYSDVSDALAGIFIPSRYRQDLRVVSGRVRRFFWNKKAEFDLNDRNEWRKSEYPGSGKSKSTDDNVNTSLRIQHTQKLSTTYFYTLTRVGLSNFLPLTPGQPGGVISGISIIQLPTFVSHFAGARADYRVTENIEVFEEVRYQNLSSPPTDFEVRRSLTESLSGITYHRAWHTWEVGGAYIGHLQLLGTNFGNRNNTFSNDWEGRLAWGNVRRVRLSGMGRSSKLNLVEQLGGFSQNSLARLEAVTASLRPFRLRASAERSHLAFLNQGGNTEQDFTNFSGELSHPRFSLGASRSLGSGFGALFPEDVRLRPLVSTPLPLDQLIYTPLLDRTSRVTAANFLFHLNHSLDISATWRQEKNILSTSDQNFRIFDVHGRYRIGKVTLEAGFGKFDTNVIIVQGQTGTRINRAYVRVARDFKIF